MQQTGLANLHSYILSGRYECFSVRLLSSWEKKTKKNYLLNLIVLSVHNEWNFALQQTFFI